MNPGYTYGLAKRYFPGSRRGAKPQRIMVTRRTPECLLQVRRRLKNNAVQKVRKMGKGGSTASEHSGNKAWRKVLNGKPGLGQ